MYRLFFLLIGILFLFNGGNAQGVSGFVNPMIGTGGHGHTFPGATWPFGMVQLSPDTRVDGSWDGCSGYHYSDNTIYGFSHTHLSGTGVSDWGDVLLMPMSTAPSLDPGVYASRFRHLSEKSTAGKYEVVLDDEQVKAELTVTPRCGIHRYAFPRRTAHLVVDLLHRDKTLSCNLEIVDSVTISGFRVSEGWAPEQHVYFAMRFSSPIARYKLSSGRSSALQRGGKNADGAILSFDLASNRILEVKVGISGVSVSGAMKNLETEAKSWDFNDYVKSAMDAWEAELQKITVEGTDYDRKSVFYTALYHCFIHPSLNMDVDSTYRGRDGKIHRATDFVNYSVFSLWDTYRALHPLFTLFQQKRSGDFINSFIAQFQQSGRLPMWELSSNETNCMIGFHAVSVIADAYAKGIRGFDAELAFKAMRSASEYTGFGIPVFNRNGFLTVDDESESVSKTLEYGYDNWCVGQMALMLGKRDEHQLYERRSQAYRNLFDPQTRCMRPRKNGAWLSGFSPADVSNHFTEGNSWHYSFSVPHDLEGLIRLHDGEAGFESKLDQLFTDHTPNKGRRQADVTGLIGQYAHGNEPSHHLTYLYSYLGKTQKTINRVNQVCRDFYQNEPDGLIGNEDCGQMSAWLVFSSMGFYPLCPGRPEYIVGSPQFARLRIKFENGKELNIQKQNRGGNFFNGLSMNDTICTSGVLEHKELLDGGMLNFYSGAQVLDLKRPTGDRSYKVTTPSPPAAPLITSSKQVFGDTLAVRLVNSLGEQAAIHYSTDGSDPHPGSAIADGRIVLDSNSCIRARAYSGQDSSAISSASFYKLKYKYRIKLLCQPDPQYLADGASSLFDGRVAETDWRKGNWIGIQGRDLVLLVDLLEKRKPKELELTCLQDTRSWIIFPKGLEVLTSNDGDVFERAGNVMNDVPPDSAEIQLKKLRVAIQGRGEFRYLKIVARTFGELPSWHAGKGGKAYIFAAELEIR